jgi:hypothetical protein
MPFFSIEIKWNIGGICNVQLSHFHKFSVILSFIHFFKISNSILNVFTVFATLDVRRGSMTMTYKMAWNI